MMKKHSGKLAVTINGAQVFLPERQHRLFEILWAASGNTVSWEAIEREYGEPIKRAALRVAIWKLKQLIEPHSLTVRVSRGLGFSMAAMDRSAA